MPTDMSNQTEHKLPWHTVLSPYIKTLLEVTFTTQQFYLSTQNLVHVLYSLLLSNRRRKNIDKVTELTLHRSKRDCGSRTCGNLTGKCASWAVPQKRRSTKLQPLITRKRQNRCSGGVSDSIPAKI